MKHKRQPVERVNVVCKDCGSDNIIIDGDVVWNIETQSWEVQEVWDAGGRCEDCGNMNAKWETTPYDVTVEPDAGDPDTGRGGDVDTHDQLGSIRDRKHNIRRSHVSTELAAGESDQSS